MSLSFDDQPVRQSLVEIARDFHARGWMPGTAGNLSAKHDDGHFWITASGHAKGRLDQDDFVLVGISDITFIECTHIHDRPSAETAIHRAIYRQFPAARACLHVHSIAACCVAPPSRGGGCTLALPALEMLKGLEVWDETPEVELPIFDNTLDVQSIADAVTARFALQPPLVSALMVRGHGVTVWGNSLQQAYNRVETLEFLLSYIARGGV